MKKLLITGGAGFLGKRLALELKKQYQVLITGKSEQENHLAAEFTQCETRVMDVCDLQEVRTVFADFAPDIVIHAAATKFVDLAEKNPMDCIDINILGSQNVARAAISEGVGFVLGISTDKASPPIRNMYGLSKAMMEKMFCALDMKTKTNFASVRYGNVTWSTGSVLPIWKKMHEETGIIGTTGPEMRRFFFTADEAVKLVLTALEKRNQIHGKTLALKMKSAKMEDILNVWTKHKGGKYKRIEGRPGERLDEFLIGEPELPFTEEIDIDGTPHYLIDINVKVEKPVKEPLSSANTNVLTEEEIINIIENPPIEEL